MVIHTDIDECSGVNDCEQVCVNTEGSYTCDCIEGFELDEDGRRCNGTYVHSLHIPLHTFSA